VLNHTLFNVIQAFFKIGVLIKFLTTPKLVKTQKSTSEKIHRDTKRETDFIELKPLVIGRIEEAFDIGLALGGKRGVDEDKIKLLANRVRPFMNLLLQNLGAGSKPMQAQKSGLTGPGFFIEIAIASHGIDVHHPRKNSQHPNTAPS